jgi:hypothetical protein
MQKPASPFYCMPHLQGGNRFGCNAHSLGRSDVPIRVALLLSVLWLASSAASASDGPTSPTAICRQQIAAGRTIWLHNGFETAPQISAMMVDAIDGKLSLVRLQLHRLSPADLARWRQTAMVTAVYAQQTTEVAGLLDDGAEANRMAWMPPLRQRAYQAVVAGMKSDPHFGGTTSVDDLAKAGLLRNRVQSIGPALVIASECADTATAEVLLQHHANVMARAAPNIVDALDTGVVNGDARMVKLLLDHGADACVHDRLAQERMRKSGRPFTPLAAVGRRTGLPDSVTARLACPAVASFH